MAIDDNFALIAVLLGITSAVMLTLAGARLIHRWGSWPRLVYADWVMLLLLLLSLVVRSPESCRSGGVDAVAAVCAGLLLHRLARQAWRVRADRQLQSLPKSLFAEALGPVGLVPLDTLKGDELERHRVVDLLENIIRQEVRPLTLGVEGPWGIGKTSVLNALRSPLSAQGFKVVSFSAWEYRSPDRLVEGYLDSIARSLSNHLAWPTYRRLFRRLGSGLVELSGGRVAAVLRSTFGDFSQGPPEELKREVESALRTLPRPLVLLIDDIDRLDHDEVHATLRAIRLVADLANVIQVIAYDRDQLARSIFPDDPSGVRARDYLGKIVHFEFRLGSPPQDLMLSFLDRALAPLLARVSEEAQQTFREGFSQHDFRIFAEALPTPREVRQLRERFGNACRSI